MTNVSTYIDEFSAIPLNSIGCNDLLAVDVYIKINDKFIKFKEQGDFIPEDKYNYFISKHVKNLFVLSKFKDAFINALEEIKQNKIEETVNEVGEEFRSIVEQQVAIQEIVYESFLDENLSNETVTILKNQVTDFIETVKSRNPSPEIFAKISSMNNTIAEHSLNVANLSLLFGMTVGQTSTLVLENLYMGALFHDYGKAKIPANVADKPSSMAYEKALKNHPMAGVDILKNNPIIPKQVLTIIAEHHEQFSGVGYPKGISKEAIYGLTRIVSIANIFDNLVTENRNNKSTMYKTAIKVLEYDKGKQFDQVLLPRIIDVLKLSFGNYIRERHKNV